MDGDLIADPVGIFVEWILWKKNPFSSGTLQAVDTASEGAQFGWILAAIATTKKSQVEEAILSLGSTKQRIDDVNGYLRSFGDENSCPDHDLVYFRINESRICDTTRPYDPILFIRG